MRTPNGELTNDGTVLRIMQALKTQNKTEKDMERDIGLSNGTFTAWKYRNGKSYRLHIDKIAEYLNVSPNYLLIGIDDEVNMNDMNENEINLVKMYRTLDPKRRKCLMEIIKNFVASAKYEEISRITK